MEAPAFRFSDTARDEIVAAFTRAGFQSAATQWVVVRLEYAGAVLDGVRGMVDSTFPDAAVREEYRVLLKTLKPARRGIAALSSKACGIHTMAGIAQRTLASEIAQPTGKSIPEMFDETIGWLGALQGTGNAPLVRLAGLLEDVIATAEQVIESAPENRPPEHLNRWAAGLASDVLAHVGVLPTDSDEGLWADVFRVFVRDVLGVHLTFVRRYARDVQKVPKN